MTLDRTGEPVDDEPCGCDGGWIDRDADPAVPCLACKPHLAPAARHRRIYGIHETSTVEERT